MTNNAETLVTEAGILDILRDDETRVSLAAFTATQFHKEQIEERFPEDFNSVYAIGRICVDDYRDLTDILAYYEKNGVWAPKINENSEVIGTDFEYLSTVITAFKRWQEQCSEQLPETCALPQSTPERFREVEELPEVRALEPGEKLSLKRFLTGGTGDHWTDNHHLGQFAVFLIDALFGKEILDPTNISYLSVNYALSLREFASMPAWPEDVVPECDVYDRLLDWSRSLPDSTTVKGMTTHQYIESLKVIEESDG